MQARGIQASHEPFLMILSSQPDEPLLKMLCEGPVFVPLPCRRAMRVCSAWPVVGRRRLVPVLGVAPSRTRLTGPPH